MFSLEGKIAVVTGASSGIGLAVAKRFLQSGATVIGIDRNPTTELDCESFPIDVSSESEVSQTLFKIHKRHQRLDILVNNAGIQPLGVSLDEVTPELLERTWAVNVNGVFWGIKQGAELMKRGGRIINTGSFVGQVGVPNASVYSASKAAVMHLTRLAALELAPQGITVNSVCPGTVETPAVMDIPDNPEIEFAAQRTPLGRLAKPEEIAAAFHFLASDDASYLTGVNLPVDGGIQAGWERYDLAPPPQFKSGVWNES